MKKELTPEEGKKRIIFWVSVNAVFLLVTLFLVWYVFNILQKIKTVEMENMPQKIEQITKTYDGKNRRLIDGVYVDEGEENIYPVAFMIDNHIDARKSAGLAKASLVYEAEVEGGITRYLAVFATGEDIEKIGPVRSARPYFVDWARELSSVYGHCGGSPEALVKIIKDGIIDLNEFYNGDYFWRGKDKVAPHNIYTSTEKVGEYLKKKKLEKGNYLPWKFKEDEVTQNRPEVGEIEIGFLGDSFEVGWVYKKDENSYIRHLAGKVHTDQAGDQITAKNIIIQYASAKETDSKLRLKMDIIGDGKAIVCLDGVCNEATWKKNSSAARTRFYFEDTQEVEFNAGTTWVEVVRLERDVSYN